MSPHPLAQASDAELQEACGRGEQAAWDALVGRYAGLIYSIPLKYGLGEADAADVFQTVCVTLLEKLSTVRDPQRLAAWIITTTTRESWALVRERKRHAVTSLSSPHARPPEDDGDLTLDVPDAHPLPEEQLVQLERQVLVQSAVQQLPEPCRSLVVALFTDTQERASYQDLAASLGMPLNSLGPTRARCLAKLKKLLDEVGYVP